MHLNGYKMPGIGLVCETTLWNFGDYFGAEDVLKNSQNITKCLELVWFVKQPLGISRIMKNRIPFYIVAKFAKYYKSQHTGMLSRYHRTKCIEMSTKGLALVC